MSKGKHTEGRPEISQIVEVRFTKDSTRLEWKYNFDYDYCSSEFLMKKILKSLNGKWPPFPNKYGKRNKEVPTDKKNNIIETLCPLMPSSQRLFWENLETNNKIHSSDDDVNED